MTGIEWTSKVWNPTTGCDRVSPGCDNCYALTMAKRLKGMGSAKYQRDGDPRTSGPGFGLTVHKDALDNPLRWRKPRRIFVNSMSDLFHDDVPTGFNAVVFAVMAMAERHTFQLLTKRHGRMRSLLNDQAFMAGVQRLAVPLAREYGINTTWAERTTDPSYWPLSNVWLGVSIENQQWADIRIDALRATPAAVRFLSAEPLLGPLGTLDLDGIGWVIVGGESGPGARPMHPDWARSLRDQCVSAGVPFFFKQWGEWYPGDGPGPFRFVPDYGHDKDGPFTRGLGMRRVGKKAAGRELDGRTWDEYPAGAR